MPKGKRRNKTSKSAIASFLWGQKIIYLPTVYISKELKNAADKHAKKRKIKSIHLAEEEEKEKEEEWNPSWDDDVEDDYYEKTDFKSTKLYRSGVDMSPLTAVSPIKLSPVKQGKVASETTHESTEVGIDNRTQQNRSSTNKNQETDEPQKTKVVKKKKLQKNLKLFKKLKAATPFAQNVDKGPTLTEDESLEEKKANKAKFQNRSNDGKPKPTFPKVKALNFDTVNLEETSKEIKCDDCGKTFSKTIHLTLHRKVHSQMKDLKEKESQNQTSLCCEHCGRKFERSNQLKFHKKLCKDKSKSKANFEKKMEITEKSASKTNKETRKSPELKETIKTIIPPVQSNSLKEPRKTTLGNKCKRSPQKKKFTCIDCGKEFNRQDILDFHMKNHTKTCRKCGFKIHEKDMYLHKRSCKIESSRPTLPTPVPDTSDLAVNNDNKISENEDKKRQSGPISLLEIHGEEFYENVDSENYLTKLSFRCDYLNCSSRFSDKSDLIYHIQQIHLPEKDLCCAMCGRDFEHITELTEHCLSMGHLMTQKQKSCQKAQATVIAAASVNVSKQNPVYYFTTDHHKDKSLPNPYVLVKQCDKLVAEMSEKRKTIKREIISPETTIKREIISPEKTIKTIYPENPVSLKRRTHKHRGKFRADVPRRSVYTCDTCNKKIYNRKLYLIHLNQHKREEKYKCDICERKFLSDDLLQAHRKRHEDPSYVPRTRVRQDIPFQNEYLCLRCNKMFDKRANYITHLSHHKLQDKYRCDACNKGFHNETQLQMHMQRHEKDPSYVYTPAVRPDIPLQGIYHCNICGKTVYQRRFYLIHLAQHRREEKYKCKICDRKFQSGNILRSHMTLHSDPSYVPGKRSRIPLQNVYTCSQCKKQFTDRQKYILHTNYHKRENKFQIQSESEKMKVKSYNKINESSPLPSILVPAPANRIECDDCRKLFTSPQLLKVHQLKFCKRIPCNIKCGKCSERFRTRLMLKRHEMRVHGGRQKKKSLTEDNVEHRHQCPQCSQTFNTTFGLTRHVAIYHPASDFPSFMRQDQHNNEYDDEDNADIMLPTDFCQAELSPEESSSGKSTETLSSVRPVARKKTCVAQNFRRPTNPERGKMCICALLKKYKSEKFCHNMRCPCIQAGRRCNKKCRCKSGCLNTDLRESEQQEKFKKERENMLNEERESRLIRSRSSSFENSEENLEYQPDISISLRVPTDAHGGTSVVSSKLLYSSLIPSEIVTIDENPDETLRRLPFSGFVEGVEGEDENDADMSDPLGDPEPDPEAEASPLQPTLQEEGPETISENSTLAASLSSVTLEPEPTTSVSVSASYSLSQANSLGQREFNQSACLRCQFCKQVFKIAPDFISHIMNHVDDGTVIGSSFKCPLGCTNEFSQLVTFLFHLERHNKGTNLQCKLCSSLFKTDSDREMHTKAYHYNPTVCGLCFAELPDSDSLLTHWTKVHPTYQCGVCSVKFFAYEDLTFHMKSLHSPYECTRCNWRTEKILDLVAHHRHNHANVARPRPTPEFKCIFCGEIYDNMGVLNKHLSSHTIGREKVTVAESTTTRLPASAPSSGESLQPEFANFTESSTTKVNNDNVEPMEEFNCQVCGSHFQSKKGLMKHLRSHSELFLCSVCNSLFKTLADMQNHLRESTCKVFECEVCFKNFQNRYTLRQHLKGTHNIYPSPSTSKTTLEGDNSWNPKNSSKDSFPVIIASKSLAPNAQWTVNQNKDLARDDQEPFRLQPTRKTQVEIEEIVLE